MEIDQYRSKSDTFSQKLLKWYNKHKRGYLFWRKTLNPYHILVAEMMLQKTTVKQVQQIIPKFLEHFPTPRELAKSPIREIEKVIRPLGMQHHRASRFQKLASIIVEQYKNVIPETFEALILLPGVGRYIANSVLYQAFNKDVPIVDTNIIRIIERVFDYKSERKRARTDTQVWAFVKTLMPIGKSKEVNYALLDFGALVCTAKKPQCPICSLNNLCNAYQSGKI